MWYLESMQLSELFHGITWMARLIYCWALYKVMNSNLLCLLTYSQDHTNIYITVLPIFKSRVYFAY
jgi:hypothetical protein